MSLGKIATSLKTYSFTFQNLKEYIFIDSFTCGNTNYRVSGAYFFKKREKKLETNYF